MHDRKFVAIIKEEEKNWKAVGFADVKKYREALLYGYNTSQCFNVEELKRGLKASQVCIRFNLAPLQNKADSFIIEKLIKEKSK